MGETVNHPEHYGAIEGIECIDVVQHFNFCVGNAIKYLWRAGLKDDDPTEDLRKARWYITHELERVEAENLTVGRHATSEAIPACPQCHGAGRIVPRTGEPPQTPEELLEHATVPCDGCNGTGQGWVLEYPPGAQPRSSRPVIEEIEFEPEGRGGRPRTLDDVLRNGHAVARGGDDEGPA